MTNEEMKRTMEFILAQQSQFAASIQSSEETRVRDNARLVRVEESFLLLVKLAQTTDEGLDRVELVVSNHDESLAKLEEKMKILAETQAHADERVSALSDIVRERFDNTSN
jgi:hypothetical protein